MLRVTPPTCRGRRPGLLSLLVSSSAVDAESEGPMSDPQLTGASSGDVDEVGAPAGGSPFAPADQDAESAGLSQREFSCHCCYDVLVNPTTLNCGHSFCRHCLALWWESAGKTECPECRERWEGFPKVNILLR